MNRELKLLITNQCMRVRSIYEMFDRCHDTRHFDEVFAAASYIVDNMNTNDSIIESAILLSAAYHDTGRLINEWNHHAFSVIIIRNDKSLKEFMMTHMADIYEPAIELACQMIFYHRRKYHTNEIGLPEIFPEKVKECCRILYDCDKCMQSDKDRVLYRYIAYYLDNIAKTRSLKSVGEVIKMVENRWKKLGEGEYVGFNPVSETFKNLSKSDDFKYMTGPFKFTKEDIEKAYYKYFD